MKVLVEGCEVKGSVSAPPSKSYTHRAFLLAALAGRCEVRGPLLSGDTRSTLGGVEALGAVVKEREDVVEIEGFEGEPETPENVLDVGNSGTTLRLLTGVSSLVRGAVVLTGDASLRRRPNQPLLNALNSLGAEAFSTRFNGLAPLVVRGRLQGGKTFIEGGVSSQFISALLIAAPFARVETTIVVKGELKSRPYVDITLELLEKSGIEIVEETDRFVIPARQKLKFHSYRVPGDFSSASYLLAAGAMLGEVRVEGLYPSRQGDAVLLEILSEMGAEVDWDKKRGVVSVRNRGELRGVEVDVSLTPDLMPTLAVLGAVARGEMVIGNALHVRYKETDRLHAMATELGKMGVRVVEEKDRLIVKGGGELRGASLHGWDDHRIVMALTIAGMAAKGITEIDTAEAVSISYPGFFNDLKRLQAKVWLAE